MPRQIPKYRKHSNRDYAIVQWHGKRHRLPGKYNSAESRAAYAAFLRQISADLPSQDAGQPGAIFTVSELVLRFLRWANPYYGGNKEFEHLREACKVLVACCEHTLVHDFRALALKTVRDSMVSGAWTTPPRPWSRTHVNHQTSRLRRVFKWGVEHELVPAEVLFALQSVQPLRKGRSSAKEAPPVLPVAPADVEAVLPYVSPIVAAMVRLHHVTGMRSANVCMIRPCEIDRGESVWVYRPAHHKGSWIGSELQVFLGPNAQSILLPFLDRDPEAYCFSPLESESARGEQRRAGRKTKVQPSQVSRKLANPKRPKRDHYTPYSYRRAIWYGFEKADKERKEEAKKAGTKPVPITRWHPHQLRHTCGTLVRKTYGLEGAQVYLGHGSANVTQIYAERDRDLARRIAEEIG